MVSITCNLVNTVLTWNLSVDIPHISMYNKNLRERFNFIFGRKGAYEKSISRGD